MPRCKLTPLIRVLGVTKINALRQLNLSLVKKLNPDILMMQAAKDWNRRNMVELLRAPKVRSISIQGEMGPDLVVI
jgi:hypothetical protein